MRLVQVRDLLQGQGWSDVVLHRMNAPYGLAMHWSRLVDGPLALLVLVSERFAVTAWPLFLLGCVLLLLARIAFALGGRAAMITVLLLTLLCTEVYGAFAPGNIDHHGLQLALMLVALLGLVEQRPILTAAAVCLGLGSAWKACLMVWRRPLLPRCGYGTMRGAREFSAWHWRAWRWGCLLRCRRTAPRRYVIPIRCSMPCC